MSLCGHLCVHLVELSVPWYLFHRPGFQVNCMPLSFSRGVCNVNATLLDAVPDPWTYSHCFLFVIQGISMNCVQGKIQITMCLAYKKSVWKMPRKKFIELSSEFWCKPPWNAHIHNIYLEGKKIIFLCEVRTEKYNSFQLRTSLSYSTIYVANK